MCLRLRRMYLWNAHRSVEDTDTLCDDECEDDSCFQVGCDPDYGLSTVQLIECLRYKHFEEIVNASTYVWRRVSAWWKKFLVNLGDLHPTCIGRLPCTALGFPTPTAMPWVLPSFKDLFSSFFVSLFIETRFLCFSSVPWPALSALLWMDSSTILPLQNESYFLTARKYCANEASSSRWKLWPESLKMAVLILLVSVFFSFLWLCWWSKIAHKRIAVHTVHLCAFFSQKTSQRSWWVCEWKMEWIQGLSETSCTRWCTNAVHTCETHTR